MTASISHVATAQPDHCVNSEVAAQRIADRTGRGRLLRAIARSSQVERRYTAIGADYIGRLTSIGERNEVYKKVAPELALRVGRAALHGNIADLGCLISTSCTGYMVPGWDVGIARDLGLAQDLMRLPITQAGCSGGVLALARAADYVCLHPRRRALVMSVELCSLAFHADSTPGNLVSALLFGDGAGAALLQANTKAGLQIVASQSTTVPCSEDAIGFDLTDNGFYPRLALDVADILPGPTLEAATRLLKAQELQISDLSFLLLHPGGPRILDQLEDAFGVDQQRMRWSYASLRDLGNTSSAAIFDVIRRYLEDANAPRGWGLVAGFGPGISIEMLLVYRC